MITKVLAVYDVKAQMYKAPFYVTALGLGVRMFSDACQDSNTDLFKHPTDFMLFHIADYDDVQGKFENLRQPLQLATAADFVQKPGVPVDSVIPRSVTTELVQ